LILIISNSKDHHADVVTEKLNHHKTNIVRFNIDSFPKMNNITIDNKFGIFSSTLQIENKIVDLSKIKVVWFRHSDTFGIDSKLVEPFRTIAINETNEVMKGFPSIIDAIWINDPKATQLAHNKINQLEVAKRSGFEIPHTLITNIPEKVLEFYSKCNQNIIIKQLARNFVSLNNKDHGILTNKVSKDDLEKESDSIRLAPCLFQEYIPKRIEIRVTVLKDKIFPIAIFSQSSEKTSIDWRRYDLENTPHMPYDLPKDIENKCFKLMKESKLIFGAIDLILTPTGKYIFLDINPNGQWLWLEKLTGVPITSSLVKLLVDLDSE